MANGLSTLSKLMTISNVWGKLGNTNMVQAKNYRTELDTKNLNTFQNRDKQQTVDVFII